MKYKTASRLEVISGLIYVVSGLAVGLILTSNPSNLGEIVGYSALGTCFISGGLLIPYYINKSSELFWEWDEINREYPNR